MISGQDDHSGHFERLIERQGWTTERETERVQ